MIAQAYCFECDRLERLRITLSRSLDRPVQPRPRRVNTRNQFAFAVRRDHHMRIGQLHGRVGTILFDEGHREPAPSWARVVRGFCVPTVLFSATPFRGDLKIFDVDDDHIHFLSFGPIAILTCEPGVRIRAYPVAELFILHRIRRKGGLGQTLVPRGGDSGGHSIVRVVINRPLDKQHEVGLCKLLSKS